MYIGGGIETQDWIEVEPVDELDEEDVNVIHEKLIAMNKRNRGFDLLSKMKW